MKYFFDTEFIEDISKWTLAKNRHFIDLISIGIVAEDGREYYAISKDFNPDDASQWVKENVLYPIMVENGYTKNLSNLHGKLGYSRSAIKDIQKRKGKSNKQIAVEIAAFVNEGLEVVIDKVTRADCWNEKFYQNEFAYIKRHNTFIPETIYSSGFNNDGYARNKKIIYNQPVFYGYFADYDWVLFCSLYGKMIDLPKGFPMYCRDLKQMLDEALEKEKWFYARDIWSNSNRSIQNIGTGQTQADDRPATLEEKLKTVKQLTEYPKQKNEHNALADAKWNLQLFNFTNYLNARK